MIVKGLLIKQPWLDLIFSGQKVCEMRSRRTKIRGEIGLIQSGSGLILGTCKLIDCAYIESFEELQRSQDKHYIRYDGRNDLLAKYRWAWQISGAKRFEKPLPYQHPRGAVIWVNL